MSANIGHKPRAIIKIGDNSVVLAESFEMQKTNKAEASTATITIPLESVDGSVFLQKDSRFFCEIWVGYVDENDPCAESDLIEMVQNKTYDKFLFKRYHGVIDQPEFNIGMKNEMILHCRDIFSLLSDVKMVNSFTGNVQCRADNVVKKIQSFVKGITITIDPTDAVMHTRTDEKTKEAVFNVTGKTYWEVLMDVARQCQFN